MARVSFQLYKSCDVIMVVFFNGYLLNILYNNNDNNNNKYVWPRYALT